MSGADFRRCLGGQGELEFVEQELELRLGLCVAGEAQFAPIGRWQINVDHLHGREFLEHAARGEAWRERLQLLAERDVQAVGEEGDKDVRFDAPLFLVEHRPDGQIAFERFEGGFDLDELQIELPELGRIRRGEVRAQQIASFASANLLELVAIELVSESSHNLWGLRPRSAATRPVSSSWRLQASSAAHHG